jgi:hypothetical protein
LEGIIGDSSIRSPERDPFHAASLMVTITGGAFTDNQAVNGIGQVSPNADHSRLSPNDSCSLLHLVVTGYHIM